MPASFYILALLTVVTAVCAMSFRNLVHCALSLALSFISVAALFLQLNAPFVAFAQMLVYVGAVAILIVFAILLTRNSETTTEKRSSNLAISIPLTLLLGGVLVAAISGSNLAALTPRDATPTVAQIGKALLTTHIVPLEFIGLLLTISLLGAVVLALPDKKGEVEL